MTDEQNRNNRGNHNNRPRHRDEPAKKQGVDMLPHPEVLEAYDYIVEGSAKMILDMFASEQKHRHEWERQALKTHTFSSILGQVLGFVIALAIFVSATVIGLSGSGAIAAFIWVFGFCIVAMTALVWAYAKSMGQRPLFARPAMRTHFRPEKEKEGAGKQPRDAYGNPVDRRTPDANTSE